MLLYVLLAVLLALSCVSACFRYSRFGRLMILVPGPNPVPLVGNMFDMALDREQLFVFCRRMYREFGGGVSRLQGCGLGHVNIYRPQDLEVILSSMKYIHKLYPYNFLQPWLGNGLLTNNGERWQHRRKLLTRAFHFSILRRFTWSFTEHTRALIHTLHQETTKPETHVQPLITAATLGIMCDTSMGNTTTEDTQTYFDALHAFGKTAIRRTANVWLYPDFIYRLTPTYRAEQRAVNTLHKFTKRVIQKRRENRVNDNITDDTNEYGGKTPLVMLDLLLENEKEGNIDDEGIREEVDTFMFEGHDTTSASLCFMIMRIANEPLIQERIYEELHAIFGDSDRDPTADDLNDMKYLERCIKESLRLYPGVPYISRELPAETVLNGYTVPATATVGIHIFDIHRNADQFPDPERFDPDRFLPEVAAKRHPYAYIPFSAGPRNCIGQKFAMLEMKTVMSSVLRRFTLEPITTPHEIVFVADLVLRARDPIYVRFTDRQ